MTLQTQFQCSITWTSTSRSKAHSAMNCASCHWSYDNPHNVHPAAAVGAGKTTCSIAVTQPRNEIETSSPASSQKLTRAIDIFRRADCGRAAVSVPCGDSSSLSRPVGMMALGCASQPVRIKQARAGKPMRRTARYASRWRRQFVLKRRQQKLDHVGDRKNPEGDPQQPHIPGNPGSHVSVAAMFFGG